MKTVFLLIQLLAWGVLTFLLFLSVLSIIVGFFSADYGTSFEIKSDGVAHLVIYFIWTNQLFKEIKE